jgi:HlyD family secretion protein
MTVISLPTATQATPPSQEQVAPPRQSRWNDPLSLIQNEEPAHIGRLVLWMVTVLFLILLIWAAFGKLDIVATAEGKLVPQTLVKIVQPAEAGVIKQLLVQEGDVVKEGQVLARLDPTLATADTATITNDLAAQLMQERRLLAELSGKPMAPKAGDDITLYAQVQGQWLAKQRALNDALAQEQALLRKAESERKSANETLSKLQQTLPSYNKTAKAYQDLEKEGFVGNILSSEKQREAVEKSKDLDAQLATVAALSATIEAQQKKIQQLQSSYASEAQKELAEVRSRIQQLRPNLDKTAYREGLMELKAPQDGTVKDVATTTVGAVVQPGTVVLTLVPTDEKLYADVSIKNEDIGFIQVGQKAQVKLAAFPFQKYGLLTGQVIRISADSTESSQSNAVGQGNQSNGNSASATLSTYKARIELERQQLDGTDGMALSASAGMQIAAEIHQGRRTVLQYLLSPVSRTAQEAGREK